MKKIRALSLLVILTLSLSAGVAADDNWISVRSKNFHLIGNAKENEIRAAATRLEQFRQVFALLFPRISLTETVGTNVVVFKNEKSYMPFLPKRADGKPDKRIAGYFQPGEEVNYITLSAGGDRKDTYETIFHEYVHSLLSNNFERSQIPPWLNEGLAEYYSTFEIEDDQKVVLGNLRNDHLMFLSTTEFIPLTQFFAVDNYSLHRSGDHSRSVFYAQAWALVHYFAIRNETDKLSRFIELAKNESDPEKAFAEAFGYGYGEMEKILRKYVKQRKFTRLVATFKQKLVFEEGMTATPLAEADALAYLGDLLFRQNELSDAEIYLNKALALNPEQVRANTSMGLVKMRLKKNSEAKPYLEKAVAAGSGSYYAHYSYASLLSREDEGEDGLIGYYGEEKAKKIRVLLTKAIGLNPDFAAAYDLYAFVNLVMDENLGEAEEYLKKSLRLQPGNDSSLLNLAQIYIRRKEFEKAESIANEIMRSAVDEKQRYSANQILAMVKNHREVEMRNRELAERFRNNPNDSFDSGAPGGLSSEELEKIERERELTRLNNNIVKPAAGEVQEIGFIRKISCNGSDVTYKFEDLEGNVHSFRSVGFQKLKLVAVTDIPEGETVNCDYSLTDSKVVVNFLPTGVSKKNGQLKAVTFVPDHFRFKSEDEIAGDKKVIFISSGEGGEGRTIEVEGDSPEAIREAIERERKRMMDEGLHSILRKPLAGETRVMGVIEKVECSSKGFGLSVATSSGKLSLSTRTPQQMLIVTFRRDIDANLRCGKEPPKADVVVTYAAAESGSKSDGKLIALEFVPEGFTID
ncbi:MAG: tetratricopeptide repeat protein [Acidobacteriota bacterium]|nr:tetratricopeptide repeat protein [Acidobacteriota bacterium]